MGVESVSPKMGRPFSENPKTASIHIRVTPHEKKEIVDFTQKNGCTILDLIKKGMKAEEKK